MSERLSALDVSFLYLEEPTSTMHVGSVMIFDAGGAVVDFDLLTQHVLARISPMPRYRQRLRWVPARLANPVWVDDEHFDIGYHVRRSALPRPGTDEQLEELVARVQSRQLDRSHPLWELILVEGLSQGRFAVLTKVHQTLVDGVHAVDLGQVVLDRTPSQAAPPVEVSLWKPSAEPTAVELLASAVIDSVRRPQQLIDNLRTGAGDLRTTAGKAVEALQGLASAARTASRPTTGNAFNRQLTDQRRFVMVTTDLKDYRRVRNQQSAGRRRKPARQGQQNATTSVNDVVLATLAGALRAWLLTRGEPVRPTSVVRALVPVSVQADDAEQTGALGRVSSIFVDLPTGEPSPLVRLYQVAYQTKAHREAGQAVAAPTIAGMAGFAPPTLHSLGARVASGLSRRLFNLVITNVPGPQVPLYLTGARMLSSYPVTPLAPGQALSIGLTSYDGGVYYGLNADRDAVPDVAVLGQCILDALAELLETVR